MTRIAKFLNFLALLAASVFIMFVIWPREPKPLDDTPSKTVDVKFVEKRSLRLSLGREAEMRLAIIVKGPTQPAISVVCPREFVPESGKQYAVNGYELRDEDGKTATNMIWILMRQPPEKP